MQAFLGLLFFSVLLTIGASLQCDICAGAGKTCSKLETCPSGMDTCMSVLTEMKAGSGSTYTIAKSCNTKQACEQQKEASKTQAQAQLAGTVITVECNKAPPSAASLLLALSGFLLLKILV